MDNSTLTEFAIGVWNILVIVLLFFGAMKGFEYGDKGEVAKGWGIAIVTICVCVMLVITPD